MTTLTTRISITLPEEISARTAIPRRKHINVAIYLIALQTSLAGLLYGLDTGSIGPITEMPQFRESVEEISDINV